MAQYKSVSQDLFPLCMFHLNSSVCMRNFLLLLYLGVKHITAFWWWRIDISLVFSWDETVVTCVPDPCLRTTCWRNRVLCILWLWSMGTRSPLFPWTGVHQTLRHGHCSADDRWSDGTNIRTWIYYYLAKHREINYWGSVNYQTMRNAQSENTFNRSSRKSREQWPV